MHSILEWKRWQNLPDVFFLLLCGLVSRLVPRNFCDEAILSLINVNFMCLLSACIGDGFNMEESS